MKKVILILFVLFSEAISAQGSFAPAAGKAGSTAVYKDSVIIKSWASSCQVKRGFIDIQNKAQGRVNFGTEQYATGKSNPKAVSLGDSGLATVTYNGIVFNGPGADFCVFENSFNNEFLELAFVEVSSDGVNFFRFSAVSETETKSQIGSFDILEATEIYNLAGKYKGQYGTPFDLEELKNTPGLNIDSISHIRMVDVIGSIDTGYASKDSKGNVINDPYPTNFKNGDYYTGGFDLEAVGLINYIGEIFTHTNFINENLSVVKVYPNPVKNVLTIEGVEENISIRVVNISGAEIEYSRIGETQIDLSRIPSGIYFIEIRLGEYLLRQKFLKL